jgi:pyruvate kinase
MTYESRLRKLHREIQRLIGRIASAEALDSAAIARVHESHGASARNFAHYRGLRGADLRKLQADLAQFGLSSLGRCEGNVLGTVLQIRRRLDEALAGFRPARATARRGRTRKAAGDPELAPPIDPAQGDSLLDRNTRLLFGDRPRGRHVYVLLTCPELAEISEPWIDQAIDAGADAFRINLAHGTADDWRRVIERIRRRSSPRRPAPRILVDLPGPKLRTGTFPPGPRFSQWKVERDRLGRLVRMAWIPLVTNDPAHGLSIPEGWPTRLEPGDRLRVTDTRDRRIDLFVRHQQDGTWLAAAEKNLRVLEGAAIEHWRDGRRLARGTVGPLLPLTEFIELRPGDCLLITDDDVVASIPVRGENGEVLSPARVACPVEGWFNAIRPGERILFDDGKIGAVIESIAAEGARLRITRTPGDGPAKLRAGKGINFPDSQLALPSLSETDRAALAFAIQHADGVAVSFVRSAQDVAAVQEELAKSSRRLSLVLKIETQSGFANLPAILYQGMRSPSLGVMIARGDLAVECGFERLAEVQEEILWLCEAAHVPVIWATQVFENLAQRGLPTRAEVTDAAMSVRAECVMLNKGPHIGEAVRSLVEILHRMEDHFYKKKTLFRALGVVSQQRAPEPGRGAAGPREWMQ